MIQVTIKKTMALMITACLLFAGCNSSNKPSGHGFTETALAVAADTKVPANNKMLTIRLVVNDTYCKKTACSCIQDLASREYDALINRLKTDYKIDLQLTYCMEQSDLEDSLKTKKYDGAICKPWAAFRHLSEYNMKLKRVADVLDPTGNGLLSAHFIVKKESSIQNPHDINGKILAIGQEDSYEKYNLPMEMLNKEGLKPEQIINKSICSEGINMLLDGTADVAVVSDYALTASCAVDFASADAFRTIWKTSNIPLCSVILDLNKMSQADAARLQNALLQLSGDKAPKDFSSRGFVKPVSWIPASLPKDAK